MSRYQRTSPRYSSSGGADGVPAREDEALVDADLRRGDQAELLLDELARPVVALARGVEQLAGVPVRPAVVGAAQERGVPAVRAADAHAAVPARVQEDANDAVVVAKQDRRDRARRAGDTKSPGSGISLSCPRKNQARPKIRSTSSSKTSGSEKIRRETRPSCGPHDLLEVLAAAESVAAGFLDRCHAFRLLYSFQRVNRGNSPRARFGAQSNTSSGSTAETTAFGASTSSLIWRSTATLSIT